MIKFILASGSPRRRDLLNMLGLDFEIRISSADETIPAGISPHDAVKLLSRIKAESVSADYDECVIAADTVVYLDGEILGKPIDTENAVSMLKKLSGNKHQVLTGLTVLYRGKTVSVCESTTVIMRNIKESEINAYVNSGAPLDKAGAYGIQEKAALFISGIEGDYFNVVGLPLCRLSEVLSDEFGIELIN